MIALTTADESTPLRRCSRRLCADRAGKHARQMHRQRVFAAVVAVVVLNLAQIALMAPAAAASLGDDGLHKQDWFSLTFRDIEEDIIESSADGKRLVLLFEQAGCIYCKKLHDTLLSDPEVADYLKSHFVFVQYNLFGNEEVTDLDGQVLDERDAASRWGAMFTPFMLFMPDAEELADLRASQDALIASDAAVASMPGVFGKKTFLHFFQWISEKGYDGEQHFQQYHASRLKAAGQ